MRISRIYGQSVDSNVLISSRGISRLHMHPVMASSSMNHSNRIRQMEDKNGLRETAYFIVNIGFLAIITRFGALMGGTALMGPAVVFAANTE